MKIIQRHYLKEFLKLFFIILIGISTILSLIDLVNKIDDFMQHNPPIADVLLYSASNMPGYMVYLMPMATLISSLFITGQAGRMKETTAIKAAGGSIKRLMMPFIYTGLFLSLAGFLLSEFIVPHLSANARRIQDSITKNKGSITFKEGTAWFRTGDHIVKIDLYMPDKGVINGISIFKIEAFALTKRIEARSAEWKPVLGSDTSKRGVWYLNDVTEYDIATGKTTKHKGLQSEVIDPPDILNKGIQRPDEMTLRELYSYTRKLESSGMKNIKLTVDINSRISFPLINIVMIVLGIALASRTDMGSGLVTSAIAIFISLLYWLGYTSFLSMGYTGLLDPVIAAWIVPLIFGAAAFYMYKNIPE
ncbi:MAG: LptF/LptG family permease [Nitrospirota bacterium]